MPIIGNVVGGGGGVRKLFTSSTNTVISPSADYAEVGEWEGWENWSDEEKKKDRRGYFVAIAEVDDNTIKIRKATSTDDVRGVTASHPGFAGNASKDKYDESGNLLPQYSYVGLMGIVSVIDNGTFTADEISKGARCMPDANGMAMRSDNNMGYAVLSRYDEIHVLVAIEPGADMIQRIKQDQLETDAKIAQMDKDLSNTIVFEEVESDSPVKVAQLKFGSDNLYPQTTASNVVDVDYSLMEFDIAETISYEE